MNTSNTLLTLITATDGSKVEKFHDDHKQIYIDTEWWINTIAYITVVCGLGNIVKIMQRGFLKNVSMCFYMSILALGDTGR